MSPAVVVGRDDRGGASGSRPRRIEAILKQRGGVPDDELNRGFREVKPPLPVLAYLMPSGVDIPDFVVELREHKRGEPVPNVGPNHVFRFAAAVIVVRSMAVTVSV